jgi:hypothetical protein
MRTLKKHRHEHSQSEESYNIENIFLPQEAVYTITNKKEQHSYQDEHI